MAETKSVGLDGGNRQKIMIAIVVAIFLFVIWQASTLFGGGSAPETPAPQAEKPAMSANSPGVAAAPVQSNSSPSIASTLPSLVSNTIMQIDPAQLKEQRENEAKYLNAINQLQLLKVQKEIAEMNQAITKSKLETIESEKSMSDLLVKPAPPPVPEGAYANSLVSPTLSAQNVRSDIITTTTTTVEPNYIVLSVSRKDNQWRAVIGNQGKLYSVTVGDNVPVDGSLVVSINGNGVTLQKDGKQRRIQLSSSI